MGTSEVAPFGKSWYLYSAMKRLQPVVWQKGTLLTPQHLQIQDRFIESLCSSAWSP